MLNLSSNKLTLLLLGAFMLRMISLNMNAPVSGEVVAQSAEPTEQPEEELPPEQPFVDPPTGYGLVVQSANTAIDSAIYSRAHVLLTKAQESGDAALWLNEYRQKLTSDLKAKQQNIGVFDGDAEKFNTGLNRTGESAALALALMWLEQPQSKESAAAAYSLDELIVQLQSGGIAPDDPAPPEKPQ